MTDTRLTPMAGLFPSVVLTDRQWERVIEGLCARGTADHAHLAGRIDAIVQASRRRRQTTPAGTGCDPAPTPAERGADRLRNEGT